MGKASSVSSAETARQTGDYRVLTLAARRHPGIAAAEA